MSAFRPSSARVRRPCSKSARMKRVAHGTSAASSAKARSASRIAVDRDQRAGRAEPVGDEACVPGGAERAVDRDLAGLGVERFDELTRQDRNVCAWHVKQDGQGMR